ncbi:MAG: alpha/beta hydrolase [Thermodesulfobacteriota bacterium]|nr:alpha/beta hydrolase [Thermodesulfobacteriota bacterium]
MNNASYKFFVQILPCLVVFIYLGCTVERSSGKKVNNKRCLGKYPDGYADKGSIPAEEEFSEYSPKHRFEKEGKGIIENGRPEIRKRRRAVTDFKNVKYGPHERNVMDFWKADSDKPVPVIVFFHGGGFVKGQKRLTRLQEDCLKNGISAVSADYRFVKSKGIGIREVMYDGARVIQFLRSKEKEWNIDPSRIALSGASAGGNMSLWLAMHDDLADPESKDPISQFSTRVTCVVAIDSQTSNDINFIRKNIGGNPSIHRSIPLMYNVETVKELEEPGILKRMEQFSAINHTSKDDPPIYLNYHHAPVKGLLPEKTLTFVSIHNAKFGLLLKDKLDSLGVECKVGYPKNRLKESALQFILRHFKIGESLVHSPKTAEK